MATQKSLIGAKNMGAQAFRNEKVVIRIDHQKDPTVAEITIHDIVNNKEVFPADYVDGVNKLQFKLRG